MLKSDKAFAAFAAKNRRFIELNKVRDGTIFSQGLLQRRAMDLFAEERKVYSQVYRGLKSEAKGNACANFIF